MVLEQLACTADGVGDRFPVAREREPRRELDRPRERDEVVAERVGPGARVEADGRA